LTLQYFLKFKINSLTGEFEIKGKITRIIFINVNYSERTSMAVLCVVTPPFSELKMEAVYSSETLVSTCKFRRSHNTQDQYGQLYHSENQKISHKNYLCQNLHLKHLISHISFYFNIILTSLNFNPRYLERKQEILIVSVTIVENTHISGALVVYSWQAARNETCMTNENPAYAQKL
jgi:hypothetical protein